MGVGRVHDTVKGGDRQTKVTGTWEVPVTWETVTR